MPPSAGHVWVRLFYVSTISVRSNQRQMQRNLLKLLSGGACIIHAAARIRSLIGVPGPVAARSTSSESEYRHGGSVPGILLQFNACTTSSQVSPALVTCYQPSS